VGRQPIFGEGRKLEGYELLFSWGAAETAASGEGAASDLITSSSLLFGLEKLVGNKRAFFNFTEGLLRSDAALALPPAQTVLEIPGDVSADPDTIEACRRLKDMGYKLALSDFLLQPETMPYVDLADIVKEDFKHAVAVDRARVAQSLVGRGVSCLALNVDAYVDCTEAEQLGYTLFQGLFYCEPSAVTGRGLSASGMVCMEAFREVSKPDIDFDRVANIIKRDVSFTYKLLRFVNSAALGLRTRIHSIKQALVILGRKEAARWLSLVALRDFGTDKPDELIMASIIRGRMSEILAPSVKLARRAPDLFLLGVFSAIDALVDRPVAEVVADLPLAEDVQKALLGEPNELREVLDLVLAYERSNWGAVEAARQRMGLRVDTLTGAYLDAVAWGGALLPDLCKA
jgi:EAL and modified HD-GYP domain-containing signal transduction protein